MPILIFVMSNMAAIQPAFSKYKRVAIRNPIALRRIAEAVLQGIGRNESEAAENLVIEGSDRVRAAHSQSSQPNVSAHGNSKLASSL